MGKFLPGGTSMSVEKIESKAFQPAPLNSESYRIVGLLCLFSALMLYAITRGFAAGEFRLLLGQTLVLGLAIAYEVLLLSVVKKALRQERDVSPEMWVLNTLIETQLPTIALFLLI